MGQIKKGNPQVALFTLPGKELNQPFTDPRVRPETKYLDEAKNRIVTGTDTIRAAAENLPQSVLN